MTKPKAILTVAPIAAGKTTWAEKFIDGKWAGGWGSQWVWVEADRIRESLVSPPSSEFLGLSMHDRKVSQRAFVVHDQLIQSAAKAGQNLVISDTNLDKRFRMQLTAKLESLGYEVELKIIHCDLETSLARNALREGDRRVPDEIVKKYHASFVHQFMLPKWGNEGE